VTLRAALWDAVGERQKLIATEAFPDMKDAKAAASALAKILGPTPDRGDSVFAAIESVLRFGDRDKLIAYFDQRLKRDPSAMLGVVDRALGVQLEMFNEWGEAVSAVKLLRDQLEEAVQRAPFEKTKRA
jgi:predicted TPR repeat methyltransferase